MVLDEKKFNALLKEKGKEKELISYLMTIVQKLTSLEQKVIQVDKVDLDPVIRTLETLKIENDLSAIPNSIKAIAAAMTDKLERIVSNQNTKPTRLKVIRNQDGLIDLVEVEYTNKEN